MESNKQLEKLIEGLRKKNNYKEDKKKEKKKPPRKTKFQSI